MAQYRKKPVVIEAFQWTADIDQADDPVWIVEALNKGAGEVGAARIEVSTIEGVRFVSMTINTLEGPISARPGDYIIRGVKGEIYPCKPDIFAATYDDASKPAPLTYLPIIAAPVDGTEIVYLHPNDYVSSCVWRDGDEGRAEGWWDDAISEYVTPSWWLGVLPPAPEGK